MLCVVSAEAVLLWLAAVEGLVLMYLALAVVVSVHLLDLIGIRREHEKEETLVLAKHILPAYESRGMLSAAVRSIDDLKRGALIRRSANLCMLGGTENRSNGDTAELETIIGQNIAKGRSMKEELRLFCKRLESELEDENAKTSLVGGMRSLTYAGAAFFVPLLGGVSSGILGYLHMQGHAAYSFKVIVWLYSLLILALTSLFGSPGSGILLRAYRTMPYVVLATLTLTASSLLLTNI